jgi:hypothetical protein
MEAVRKKIGLGLLFQSTIEADLRRGDFKLIRCPEVNIHGNSLIVYRNDSALSEHASAFLALVRRHRRQ